MHVGNENLQSINSDKTVETKRTPAADHCHNNDIAHVPCSGLEELAIIQSASNTCPDDASPEEEADPYLVKWDGDDKENKKNLSKRCKWIIVILLTNATLCFTALSSAWGMCNAEISEEYDISPVVGELGLSFYVVGLSAGSIIAAPMSEFYGRRVVYTVGLLGFFAFQFGVVFGKNIETILISRLLQATIGSVFMSNISGTIADLFDRSEMSLPMGVFSMAPFVGPGIGPVFGGFVVQHAGWRWMFRVFLIWTFCLALLILCLVPETYPPILLRQKARRIRSGTGNNKYYAAIEANKRSILTVLRHHAYTPILMLIHEPMLLLLCIYTGFLVLLVYLFFVAFPLVFQMVYDMQLQFVGLTFLGVALGMISGFCTFPVVSRHYRKTVVANGGVSKPEFHLPQMIYGSLLCPMGLFIFAWTTYPHVHWIAPIIGGYVFRVGCFLTYNGIQLYMVEAYRTYAASASAANVFVRCAMASSSPLFGAPMIQNMNVHWSMTMLACIAVAFAPTSFLLYKYGQTIRKTSKFALA